MAVMSARNCIFAWTASSQGRYYPEYIHVTVEDGRTKISVRSPAKDDGSCGDYAVIELPREQLLELINMPFKALLAMHDQRKLLHVE